MSAPHDPRRLDVATFARTGGSLDGAWPLASMPRLSELLLPGSETGRRVAWRLRGSVRTPAGSPLEIWLHLWAETDALMHCQRCLGPVECPIRVQRDFRFVQDEHEAERLDNEMEDDVLVLSPRFDAHDLLEDELLLALPLVPRHERCEHAHAGDDASEPGPREHPFAMLAAWRKPPAD